MAKIRKDFLGLYVSAGGWLCRPLSASQFKEGQDIKTHHYGGSTIAGIGKNDTCGRGEYVEYWSTQGMTLSKYRKLKDEMSDPSFEKEIEDTYDRYQKYSGHQIWSRENSK